MSKVPKDLLKCCRCGTEDSLYWYRDYDNKRNWTGRRICYDCKLEIGREKTEKIRKQRLEERKCCICYSKNTQIDNRTGNPIWIKYRDDNGNWDDESYMCYSCYQKKWREKNIYNWYNIRKSIARCRTNDILNKEFEDLTSNEIGSIGEEIICKTLDIKNINIESDNFKSKVDTDKHLFYGYIQAKIISLEIFEKKWSCTIGKSREFDTMIILCMDGFQPWINVERVYAILIEDIFDQTSLKISKNFNGKWERCRIDEKAFNETYHNMEIYKRWLKKYYSTKI